MATDRRHPSNSRVGLNLLLAEFPSLDVATVQHQTHAYQAHSWKTTGPWTEVDLIDPDTLEVQKFAIWNVTGHVYRTDQYGAAEDDPFLRVTEEVQA